MPKAKPFSEDEKTTIESQWEDEASTTVEQGEVADKIRALDAQQKRPVTGITNTNGSGVDEPTVDDQHMANLETPQAVLPARLSVTAGNDAGVEIEIHAGKTYTIGRGLDNDFVLTDIAVSRKHFDLRNEDGSWIIVDRGSGNGTVVNGNLEDNPFMLANGDMIEIGNTTFRFDHQNADVSRGRDVSFEDDADDEEMSTVAGKPLNQKIAEIPLVDTPQHISHHSISQRPKTLPPPTPLRPRTPSQMPSYPMNASAPTAQQPAQLPPVQMPATTLPMPQMANRPPISGPQSPTILGGDAMQLNHILSNAQPTTIPGQGSPLAPSMLPMQMAPMQLHPMYGGNGYPQAPEIPSHPVHAQMLVVQQSQNRRGDHSTAHVQPVPYGSSPMIAGPMPASRFLAPPTMSKRTKYMIGGAAITLFAAVFTIVIIKSGGKAKAQPALKTFTPIKTDKVATQVPPKPEPPKPAPPIVQQPTVPTPQQPVQPTIVPPKQEPPKQTPPPVTQEPPKQTPPMVATKDPPKQTPPVPPVVKQEPPKQTPPKQEPPKQTSPKQEPKQARQEPKPPKQTPKQEPKPPKPPRVATAPDTTDKPAGGNTDALEQKAEALYTQKKFVDAANVLSQASKLAGGQSTTDGKRLSQRATRMASFGRAYNNGTAAANKPADTFAQLRAASTFDQTLGGAYENEIREKLAAVAPKAAVAFASQRDFPMAHTAVIEAEHYGTGADNNVKAVRSKLEFEAGQLFAAAVKEESSSPDSAREKYKQIKMIVDAKSQWYQKADKKLLRDA